MHVFVVVFVLFFNSIKILYKRKLLLVFILMTIFMNETVLNAECTYVSVKL